MTHAATLFSVFAADVRAAQLRPLGLFVVARIVAQLHAEGHWSDQAPMAPLHVSRKCHGPILDRGDHRYDDVPAEHCYDGSPGHTTMVNLQEPTVERVDFAHELMIESYRQFARRGRSCPPG